MTCEGNKDIATSVAIAANRLVEAKETNPGSEGHVFAMGELLNHLRKPGALDALIGVLENGQAEG